jgi:hypothetical protein
MVLTTIFNLARPLAPCECARPAAAAGPPEEGGRRMQRPIHRRHLFTSELLPPFAGMRARARARVRVHARTAMAVA